MAENWLCKEFCKEFALPFDMERWCMLRVNTCTNSRPRDVTNCLKEVALKVVDRKFVHLQSNSVFWKDLPSPNCFLLALSQMDA